MVTPLVGTDVGLDLAAGLQIELPSRVRLTGTVGWTPGEYAWLLKKYYTDVWDGREEIGDVLKDAATNAFVARGMLGLRPLAHHGLFFDATYSFARIEKDELLEDLVESATLHVHALGGQLGWQWGLGRGLSLQASAGVAMIIRSTASFDLNFMPANPALDALIVHAAADQIKDAGEGVIAPIASVFIGYTL